MKKLTWAGGNSSGLWSTTKSINVVMSRKHKGNLLNRFDEQSKLTNFNLAISV